MKDQKGSFPGKGNLKPEDEELRELKRRLRDVTEERDILKMAVIAFGVLYCNGGCDVVVIMWFG